MKRCLAIALVIFAIFTTPAMAISIPDDWFPDDGWSYGVPGGDGVALPPIVDEFDILDLPWEIHPNPCLGRDICGDEGTGEIGVCSTWCIVIDPDGPVGYGMMTLEETYEEPYERTCDLVSNEYGQYWDEWQQDWMYPENHTNFDC